MNNLAQTLPSLFVSHGAPDLVISGHPAAMFLGKLGSLLERPRGILVISAHWEQPVPTLTTGKAPATVHDFVGWSRELYGLQYPAPGATFIADRVAELLTKSGFKFASDSNRGFDHGTWVPLRLAFPAADIPVAQLSLLGHRDCQTHFDFGRALAPLRGDGVLIIGSGSAVHNLGALAREGTKPPAWATAFDIWLADSLANRDVEALTTFQSKSPYASLAHPTHEHFLPLLVAAGAGWDGGGAVPLHRSWSYGSLSMSAFAFGGDETKELTAMLFELEG